MSNEKQTMEKPKRVFYTSGQKKNVAYKYRDILNVIYHFGNGVMLQDQLQQFLMKSGRYKRRASVISGLAKLTEYDIITTRRLSCYRSKLVVLCGAGWSYVLGTANTRDAHYTMKYSTAAYNRSVFKTEFIIRRYLKDINVEGEDDILVDTTIKAINEDKSSVLYNKSNVLEYMNAHEPFFTTFEEGDGVESPEQRKDLYLAEIVKLENISERDKYNLMHSDKEKTEVASLPKSLIRTLHEQSCFIAKAEKNSLHICYMGYCNNDSLAAAGKAFVSACKVVEGVFKNAKFKFHIYVPDIETKNAVYKNLTTRRLSPVLKQVAKRTPFQNQVNRYTDTTDITDRATTDVINVINLDTIKYFR